MNRRGFFGALAGMLAAPFAAKVLPKPEVSGLFTTGYTGLFVPLDMDTLFGYAPLFPELVALILDDNDPSLRLKSEQRNFDPARLPA